MTNQRDAAEAVAALTKALDFLDRAAGEGLCLIADGGGELDAAEIMVALANATSTNLDQASESLIPEFVSKLLASLPAATVDSGMSGASVERAELFWANLPTGRQWTSLATHEKALVCHAINRLASPTMPAATEQEPVANSLCMTCLGFRYLRKAPSTCAVGSDVMPCPVCRQSPGVTTIAPAPSDQEKLEKAMREAIVLIDEINERGESRRFNGISGTLHSKLCTIRAKLQIAITRARQNGGEG